MKKKTLIFLIVITMITTMLPCSIVAAADKYPWIWYDYSESSGNPTAQGCVAALIDDDGVGTKKGALSVNVLSKNGTPVYSGIVLEPGVKYRFSAWIKVDNIDLAINNPTLTFVLFTKYAASSSQGYNILESTINDFEEGEWVYAEKIWTCTGKHDADGTLLDMTAGSSVNFRFGNRNDNWTNVNNSSPYSYVIDDFRIEPVYDVSENHIEPSGNLRNADFEDGFIEAFWEIENGVTVSEIAGANSTKKAVLLVGDAAYGIKQQKEIDEKTTYNIGFWAKAGSDASVGNTVSAVIDFSECENVSSLCEIVLPDDSIDKSGETFTLTDDWKYYECSFINNTVTGYSGTPYLYFTQNGTVLDMAIDEITVQKSSEIVCNGEFLSGDDFWELNNVTTEIITDDAPESYTGNVLKITETSNNGTIRQEVPIFTGKTYKIGFWAKGLSWNGSDEILKTVVTFDRTVEDNDIETVTDDNLSLNHEWQYFEYEYTPDSNSHDTSIMPKVGIKFKIGRSRVCYLLAGFSITEKNTDDEDGTSDFSGLDYLIVNGKTIENETINISSKYIGDGDSTYLIRTFVSENTRGYVLEDYCYTEKHDFKMPVTVSEKMIGRKIKVEAIPQNGSHEKTKQFITDIVEPIFDIETECTSGLDGVTISFEINVINNECDKDLVAMLAQYSDNMEMLSLKEVYIPVELYSKLKHRIISDEKASGASSAKLMIWEGVDSVNNTSVSYSSEHIEW